MQAIAQTAPASHAYAATARTMAGDSRPNRAVLRIVGNQARLRALSRTAPRVQAKLEIGATNDPLEREADQVAAQVTRMAAPEASSAATQPRLSRKCNACEVQTKRAGTAESPVSEAPPIVHEVLSSPALPLDAPTRTFFEPRLGHDFSQVRVHADERAAASARAVGALAYTAGSQIVFGAGRYAPESPAGRTLLAHELAHVIQQSSGLDDRVTGGGLLQRAPTTLGTKVTEPAGAPSPFKTVTATFDGDIFEMKGDATTIVQASGQSGHPNQVDPADVKACKGAADDSYLNNPRYVGIKDKGPIPEGTFTFLHSNMVTFTAWEDAQMALAKPGQYVDPSGLDLHGDWGAARAALTPVRVTPSKFCGSTAARSGFYLHGGVMTGSSGCIDIGNSAITDVVTKLMGYTKPVPVTVKYTKPPPQVGALGRAAGRFMYPANKDADLWDRIKSVFGGD